MMVLEDQSVINCDDQVMLLGDQDYLCLSLEDNTLYQATFCQVGENLWSINLSDDIFYLKELSQASSKEDSRF